MGRLLNLEHLAYTWTGESLLLQATFVHGDDVENSAPGGLVYNPSEDRWTRMSTEGQPAGIGCSAWTGSEFLVFGVESASAPFRAFAYDPVVDRWRKREALTVDGVVFIGCQAVWTGDAVFVWAYADQDTPDVPAVFDPETNAWRLLSKDPLVPRRYESKMAHSDGVLLAWAGTDSGLEAYADTPARRYVVDTGTWLSVSEEGSRPEGNVRSALPVPDGVLLQGETAGPNDFGFLCAPEEDRWFALQQGCAERENFFGDLVWTDYGAILWHDLNLNGAPIAWRYQGPLR